MSGFDCQFTTQPPDFFQCHCPICLLILREPHEATCCGKRYCKDCINQIRAKKKPCPTCKEEGFNCFHTKGVQQSGFKVFCSNKEGGCGWQGELGQLDQHLNVDPEQDKQFVGCAYTNVKCLFCHEDYHRCQLEDHQNTKCQKRPYSCSMCDDYKSTYEDVTTNHAPECKCRPVVCPNSCGASNLQHQHLEEHVSSQCPLTLVECEFSDAGCDAKVYRRDLPSHLSTNMVTHMSLLARENRKLKTQHQAHEKEILQLKEMLDTEKKHTQSLFRIPPIRFEFEVQVLEKIHTEEPFYSRPGGYKLQLQSKSWKFRVPIPSKSGTVNLVLQKMQMKYTLLESEFPVQLPCRLRITTKIIHPTNSIEKQLTIESEKPTEWVDIDRRFMQNGKIKLHVVDVCII